tara:strand:- start:179 stop:622 length:444 start_codon:yes stop_codon:yes gene_type:complete
MKKNINCLENRLNKVVVMTNGCFDILHQGHIYLFNEAKKLGDILVVAINSDESVKRLKGEARPVNKINTRVKNLEKLNIIDRIITFEPLTPINIIKEVKPNILVKGSDYKLEEIVGYDYVKSYGGKVLLIKYLDGHSTTNIINSRQK